MALINEEIRGKVAIVTGGSTGIGRHLVEALAVAGFQVAFSYRSSAEAAESLRSDLSSRGLSVLAVRCDVGKSVDVERFYAEVVSQLGVPDLLVNNAGIQTWSPMLELAEGDWDNVIATNLKGTFLNTKHAAKLMVAAGKGGTIVNIGSGCNKLAFPRLVDYTASKGGIEQLTKVSAVELGPHGITVNCVAPGAIMTERTDEEAPDYAATWSKITPLRRVGVPADISGPVIFLATKAASFITGQTIWVDGGVFTQAAWPYPT